MDKNDVKIGMKVVPHSKSLGCCLLRSETYQRMLKNKQQFMYVTHRHADDVQNNNDRWLLSDDKGDIYCQGDYFKSSDFEPYVEMNGDDNIG